MITIMSKHCVEDCYEELNARLRTLIGYYDDINMWRTTPISKMQMALQHVKHSWSPSLNLSLREDGSIINIIRYLNIDESTPASN
jgi:hypothetical protein